MSITKSQEKMFKKKQYGLILNPKKKQLSTSNFTTSVFGDSSDEEDSGKAGVNRLLQREAIKKKDTKQVQQAMAEAMAEDPTVYEYDEVYDKIEEDRKKTMAAKLGQGKNKPKYITSLKKAAEQRQREYERVIERKAHRERETEGDEFEDKEAFVTSAYRKKMEELEADELKLKKQEEFDERHGIHKQKDLSKFYSNLLKKNVSMGAYNVTSSSVTAATNEDKDSNTEVSEDEPKKKERRLNTNKEPAIVSNEEQDETETAEPKLLELESNDKRLTTTENERDKQTDNGEQRDKEDEGHDAVAPEVSKKRGEKRNTDEAAQAARERYLARKRLKQSAQ